MEAGINGKEAGTGREVDEGLTAGGLGAGVGTGRLQLRLTRTT